MHLLKKFLNICISNSKFKMSLITILFVWISSYIAHLVEPETFPRVFDGYWWVMTTITTVGYGDVSPVTDLGKALTTILYITGIGLIGFVIGYVTDLLSTRKKLKESGKMRFKGDNHIVVINASKRAKEMIVEVKKMGVDNKIVLIDDEKETNPFTDVHFVKGDPAEYETLEQANVLQAKKVFIFAPEGARGSLADGQTLLIASTVEAYGEENNTDTYTIAEILNSNHLKGFKNANVDEILPLNQIGSHLLAKSVTINNASSMFNQLASRNVGEDLFTIQKHPSWTTYKDAMIDLFDHGATLFAEGNNLNVHKDADIVGDSLTIITDCETYKKIEEYISSAKR